MQLLKTASRLTLVAALAAVPYTAMAQTDTETDTSEQVEQAGEDAAQATENAAEDAAQATENAAEDVEQAGEEAAQEVEQAGEEAAQEADQATEEAGQEMDQAAEGAEAEMTDGEMAEGEEQGTPPEGTIAMQDSDTILGSELMGASVYNGNATEGEDEQISEIDDLIVNLDGTVEGVVIGVGGFLGLGEKSVAIEMSQFEVRTDEGGSPRLFLNATREDLEAAEEFMTVADQEAEAQAQQTDMGGTGMATDPAATDPAATAPADPAAEAPAEGETEEAPAQ